MSKENRGPRLLGPVFCRPGFIPVQTGVPGQSRCVPYSAPSAMLGPSGQTTVSTLIPPSYPQARTFPVGAGWGWRY
jgi:hypothetical protein